MGQLSVIWHRAGAFPNNIYGFRVWWNGSKLANAVSKIADSIAVSCKFDITGIGFQQQISLQFGHDRYERATTQCHCPEGGRPPVEIESGPAVRRIVVISGDFCR